MKVYHYARVRDWADRIQHNERTQANEGLKPNRRMGREDQEAYNTTALFGLLEPQPKDWVENKDFPGAWPELKRHVGNMLVEIEVDENDPNVRVVDWANMEHHLRGERDDRVGRAQSERMYVDSSVPLKDYIARREVLGYSLPEVIFTQEINPEKINISEQQPLLEEYLAEIQNAPGFLDPLEYDIKAIPELNEWYARYKGSRESASEFRNRK